MDIFNRGPSISEDTAVFDLYPPQQQSDKASVSTLAACISDFATRLLPQDFIWHRDSFEVKLASNPYEKDAWYLEGRMRVGDCIDDEWCTVWLLREISAKWDLAISIHDTDGEFLLIEAAEELPSWVQPSNSENRVWIYKSRLHLVPLSFVSPPSKKTRRRKLPGHPQSDDEGMDSDDEGDFIAVDDALKFIRDPTVQTYAPDNIEKAIWRRISGYPLAAQDHIHKTKANVPLDIAKALSVNPSLVQKAVEAFYTRDAAQLRVAHKMSRFPPHTSVLAPINMTRTSYAQLMGQKFHPPKIFGQWKEAEGSKIWRWKDIGMKIAVGFEMLYQESKNRGSATSRTAEGQTSQAEAQKDALRRDPDYEKYIENLRSANYFRGEIQGSQLWNDLESKAASTYVEIRRADDATRPSFAYQFDAALSRVQDLPEYTDVEEDNDDWLNVDMESFDELIAQKMGQKQTADSKDVEMKSPRDNDRAEDDAAEEQAKKLKNLAAKVEDFVEGEGDLEGALFEDEMLSDHSFSDGEDEDEDEDSSEEDKEETKTTAERQADMDKLVPALDPSEYGKMPASYSKSQKTAPATVETDVVSGSPERKRAMDTGKDEVKGQERRIRPPIIPRDRYDGVDSDDETGSEEEDDESEEDKPQVVGEIEIDMGEEEEEFLEFSRQQLGISDAQWRDIITDRKDRGAFLPAGLSAKSTKSQPQDTKKVAAPPPSSKSSADEPTLRAPQPGPRPNVNPNLDSFETVMKALEEQLAQVKAATGGQPDFKGKGKGKEVPQGEALNDEEREELAKGVEDIESAMEAELKNALVDDDSEGEEPMDYKMIKNFLESFKSQAGLSGPVSNLAGRLDPGLKLPRDES